jgi:hypothetical protein
MKKYNLPLIVFIHIERCGGTTLNHSMLSNFTGVFAPVYKTTVNQKSEEFIKLDYALVDIKQLIDFYPWTRFIGGHHTRAYIDYSDVTKSEVFYLTFLRNPVERYLSHFNFQRISMGIDWKLDEFLSNPRFNNWQTFRIAGIQDISVAKKILLERFNFVGITERYNESLVLLKHILNISNFRIAYPLKNSIADKSNPGAIEIIKFDKLDLKHRNLIMKNNELDIELYEFVRNELYPRYLNKISAAKLKNEIEKLERSNSSFKENKVKRLINKIARKYINSTLTKHAFKY